MQLTERHIIKKGHSLYKEIDSVCFLSKNLYNKANYIIRQEFITTSKEKAEGKREHAHWVNYNEIQKRLQVEKDYDYTRLPAKVSQQVLMLLDKNWKSFFKSIKTFKVDKSGYKGMPSLPKYKHKTKGRNTLTYTIQAISKTELKRGVVLLSGTKIAIQTRKQNIQQVRIVPRIGYYVIEIIYNHEETDLKLNKDRIAGIDIGVSNLATVTSNVGIKPTIINGRPLKSINQYFNKKVAKLKSFVGDKSSNRIRQCTHKRNMKVDNYLHNASKYVVELLIKNNIGTLVIGKNVFWKQEVNLGRRTNQNFVSIPFARFIEMVEYKCKLVGITVVLQEESYTSKCSFIDSEPLCHQDKYAGRRKHRGLFVTKNKVKINADCNGSGNIIRKAFPNAFADGIQGVVVPPIRVEPYKLAI